MSRYCGSVAFAQSHTNFSRNTILEKDKETIGRRGKGGLLKEENEKDEETKLEYPRDQNFRSFCDQLVVSQETRRRNR